MRFAIPVRTSPSPTTKSAPIKTTLESLNPASASETVRMPVSGSVTSGISATTSMRGLFAINSATHIPSKLRTTSNW